MLAPLADAAAAALAVGGRVELATDASADRARAELHRVLPPYEECRRRLLRETEPLAGAATPDTRGLFVLTAPEPGIYRVRVHAPDHAPAETEPLAIVENLELDVMQLPRADEPVLVRVMGEQRASAQGVPTSSGPLPAPRVEIVKYDFAEPHRLPGGLSH